MNEKNIDFKFILLLGIILITVLIPTFSLHGDFLTDCGREAYYPTQILLGKILYKDIFINMYGPFPYLFNAFLFKIFGTSLNVLYIAGTICTFLITTFIYLISKKFLSRLLSFSICFLAIVIGVLNLNLFNSIFPYSYGMIYGILAFLASLYFLLKYADNSDKTYLLYVSSILAGLCIINKYEFVPYCLVIVFATYKIKKLNFIQNFNAFATLVAMPVSVFGYLFIKGLTLNDLIQNLYVVKKMIQSENLKFFYTTQNLFFNNETINLISIGFITLIISSIIFYIGIKQKNKILSSLLSVLSIALVFFFITPSIFSFLPIFIILLFFNNLKDFMQDNKLSILFFSTILISLKVFFGVIFIYYGAYFISILLVCLLAILNKYSNNIKNLNDKISIFIIFLSLIVGFQSVKNTTLNFATKNATLKTQKGDFAIDYWGVAWVNELFDYIKTNTKPTDKIVVLPEGMLVNFLTERPSDNIHNALIPLFFEVYGEDEIINHFSKNPPEYFVLHTRDLSEEYKYKSICNDYALKFCDYLKLNYSNKKTIGGNFKFIIYKKH